MLNHRPGVVTTITVLGVTAVVMTAFLTLTALSTSQLSQGQALEASEQTFFAAEGGLNEGIYRLTQSATPTPQPLTTTINGVPVTIEIDVDPNDAYNRVITSQAKNSKGQERTLQLTVRTSTFAVGLNYAVHAGAGGFKFNNGSTIYGDAHSNGSVLPANNGDQGNILPVTDDPSTTQNEAALFPGNLTISGNNNIASQLLASGTIWAHTLKGTNGKPLKAKFLKYQLIGPANNERDVYSNSPAPDVQCQTGTSIANRCDAGSALETNKPLPIGTTEIVNWANDIKVSAGAGTTLTGDQNISGTVTWNGSTKVEGNITFSNNAKLIVTGALWVTGDLTVSNNGSVTLSSNALVEKNITLLNGTSLKLAASVGENDGVVIAGTPDSPSTTLGKIVIENGVTVTGSGDAHSSLTLISTNTSTDEAAPAIDAANTAQGVIYFTQDGLIRIRPTGNLNAVFANKIYLDTNAKVTFKPSLQFFSIQDPDPDPVGIQPGTWKQL